MKHLHSCEKWSLLANVDALWKCWTELDYNWNHFWQVSNKHICIEMHIAYKCVEFAGYLLNWHSHCVARVKVSASPDFSYDSIKTNKNKITAATPKHQIQKKEVDTRNCSYQTAGKSNRQSSSLNGLNLITALFCIIFVCMHNNELNVLHGKWENVDGTSEEPYRRERLSKPIPLETIYTFQQ